jgi:hypothetical protein
VDVDKELLQRAKRLALKEGRTLSSLLNGALAAYLGARKSAAKDPEFELMVRGKANGRFPTSAEMTAIEDEEDAASLGVLKAGRSVPP